MSLPTRAPLYSRAPRLQLPALATVDVELPAPPSPVIPNDPQRILLLTPLLGFFAIALFYVARGGATSPLSILPLGLLAGVSIFSTVLLQRQRADSQRRDHARRMLDYERILDTQRARLQAAHDAVRAQLAYTYPEPAAMLGVVMTADTNLWERRPTDADFLSYRAGRGRGVAPVNWRVSHDHRDNEPLIQDILTEYRFIGQVPLILSLLEDGSTALVGKRAATLALVRSILCQIALTHAPQDVQIVVIAPTANAGDWSWAQWLPHTRHNDLLGSAFTSAASRDLLSGLAQWIEARTEGSRAAGALLLVVDDPHTLETDATFNRLLREGERFGVALLCVAGSYEQVPGDCRTLLTIAPDNTFRYQHADGSELVGEQVDAQSAVDATHVARVLAPVTMTEPGVAGRVPPHVELLELYGARHLSDLRAQIPGRWQQSMTQSLPRPVPIGRESLTNDLVLWLDEEHHGPHGMLAGTTGAGKSELLQALVCALAIEHDPRTLSLLLIDFKGGSTFNAFATLPHTVGMVTNLVPSEVRRILEALKSEIEGRQQFLKSVNVRDIHQYHRYRHTQPDYRPLPHLVVIVDEFAQLAREMPEFMSELVKTVQVGRSLGVHLVLGTQSPMDVITDEMNANLQFRICLRVQNAEASRAMLRRPDAAFLPIGRPGLGYLQVGERGLFKQFQSAYAGGEYRDHTPTEQPVFDLIAITGERTPLQVRAATLTGEPYSVARAVAEVVRQTAEQRQIVLPAPLLMPSLPTSAPLAQAHRVLRGGCNGYEWQPVTDALGAIIPVGSAPVGVVDDVSGRTQYPLWIHLNQGCAPVGAFDGHLLVVGAPASGKTMLLRTLALSLAALHAPDDLHMYFLSFTGNGLAPLGDLPHAERVVYGVETERVRRLFGRFTHALEERLAHPGAAMPIMVLFIDQYEQLRDAYRDTHGAQLERLVYEGRAVNLFVVMTASTIHAVPDRVRAVIQQRIAFQQANSADYTFVVGRLPANADTNLAQGRCFVNAALPMLAHVYLPVLNPVMPAHEVALARTLSEAVAALRDAYQRQSGEQHAPYPLQELPARLPLAQLPLAVGQHHSIVTPLGWRDDDRVSLFTLDWWNDGTHYVVTGPPVSGKTNLLLTAALSAARQYSPEDVRFVLVDFNQRSLRALEPLRHVLMRATDGAELRTLVKALQAELHMLQTHPNPPATVLVIDDYDVLVDALASEYDLLNDLRHLVRFYADVPFYVWVAGTFERASEPFIKQLLLRRSGFGMVHRDSLQRLNVRSAHLSTDTMPVGRAYVPVANGVEVVQTAWAGDVGRVVAELNDNVWSHAESAAWQANAQVPAAATIHPTARDLSPVEDTDIDIDGLIEDLMDDLRGGDYGKP